MTPAGTRPDTNWLAPDRLYLTRAAGCELDRPLFQGDVFRDIALPELPSQRPNPGPGTIEYSLGACMVIPHPCQCYHGDALRPRLTVAPVVPVTDFANFGAEMAGAKDKFALPELPVVGSQGQWDYRHHTADMSRLTTIRSKWLTTEQRVACLSHEGIGLLAKRLLGFQLRFPVDLGSAMIYTQGEWNESFLMQAWVRKYGTLNGFSKWMRTAQVILGVNDGTPVAPYEVREGALDALMQAITGQPIEEPDGSDG